MIRKANTIALLSTIILMVSCNSPESGSREVAHGHEQQAAAVAHSQNSTNPTAATNSDPAASIPDFKFYKLKSGFGFEKADIPAGRNTVFILFDPSCRHCQLEAGELAKNYDKVKNVNLLFISMNDPALMDKFLPSFAANLEGKKNVELLYDRDQQFVRIFHLPSQFPANYVYGPDGKLKTHWSGEKAIDEMLKAFVQ